MWKPTSGELYHHGILGQRWGKKNGPPYPLDSEDHSSAEKKSGWMQSLKKKHAEKKDSREYQKSRAKVGKALKKDKEFQEKLGNYIVNSQKRQNAVNSRSKEWGKNEDYYQYKDRKRKEWASSDESKQDREELQALMQRGEKIARDKLGKIYDIPVESSIFDKSKTRGERIIKSYENFINYTPYTLNNDYMSNKTRKKITWERP